MSEIKCLWCNKLFTSKKRLAQHITSGTPCDLKCELCDLQLQNPSAYNRHKEKGCEYVPKYRNSKKEKDSQQIQNIKNTMNTQNIYDNSVHYHDHKHFNVLLYNPIFKIIKHVDTFELMDKDDVFEDLMEKAVNRLEKGMKNGYLSNSAVNDTFFATLKHIYANDEHPELQNIYIDDPETNEMKIFNGEKYVMDDLHPGDRLVQMCANVGKGIQWMIEKAPDRDPELKKSLHQKIQNCVDYNFSDPDNYGLKKVYLSMYRELYKNKEKIKMRLAEEQRMLWLKAQSQSSEIVTN